MPVATREGDGGVTASTNQNVSKDIDASRWTYSSQGWGQGTNRSYLKFDGLSAIPTNATIKSAKLSLYGTSNPGASPQGNSWYPGSPYTSSGDNKTWLKRVTGANWSETTITWNNKPGTTDQNQVELAASTSQFNSNLTDIDVTNLVKDMVSSNQNYGFCFQLQSEQIYKSISFGSSEVTDAAKRPKLVVVYEQ